MLVTGRQGAISVSRNPHSARVITPSPVINRLVPLLPTSLPPSLIVRCSSSLARPIADGDIVLLERVSGSRGQFLSSPLRHGRRVQTQFGDVKQSEIIGKQYREIVRSTKGSIFRIHRPTLADYVALTPRKVTPIYSGDANVIVSLLDIHVDAPPVGPTTENASPPLEVLEAGTGHGSLTLHLARAVHAANAPHLAKWDESTEDGKSTIAEWKARRRAIIHTVDRSQDYSDAARRIVNNFRRGLYTGDVDFNTGDVTEFIRTRTLQLGREQIFAHVLLDLPDVHQCMTPAAHALQDDGVLLVFCPSVSQIASCVASVRERKLPLDHIQVLELGSGVSGGKPWDVRAAKVRNPDKASAASTEEAPAETSEDESLADRLRGALIRYLSSPAHTPDPQPPERWEMVSRPSVGHRVVGGGFVSMWRRKRVAGAGAESQAGPNE